MTSDFFQPPCQKKSEVLWAIQEAAYLGHSPYRAARARRPRQGTKGRAPRESGCPRKARRKRQQLPQRPPPLPRSEAPLRSPAPPLPRGQISRHTPPTARAQRDCHHKRPEDFPSHKSVSKKIPLHRTICTMQGLHSGYYPLNPPRRGRFQTSASRANLHPCSSDARRAAPHGGCVPGAA